MTKFKKTALIVAAAVLLAIVAQLDADAQCAMCKATVENTSDKSTSIAGGINTGILYLLSMPYLLAGVVGFLWYRKYKKNVGKKIGGASAA